MTSKLVPISSIVVACLALCGVEARAGFDVQINFIDPGGLNAAYYDRIEHGIEAAATAWGRYVETLPETLEIDLNFTDEPTGSGGSYLYGFSPDFTAATSILTYEAGALMKLVRGIDITADADAVLNIGRDWLENVLWYNPDPGSPTPPPAGFVDSHYFFMHELGHILGFASFRDVDGTLGTFPDGTPLQSTFDALSELVGDDVYFVGDHATSAYGGPVPLTYGNLSHLGNGWWTGRPGVDLVDDVMNGVVSQDIHYELSSVDVAILADLGYGLTAEGRALIGLSSPVPEPASIIALVVGLAGVGTWRTATRRRA